MSHYSWSAGDGQAVFFQLDRGPADAGRAYVLAGTDLGKSPGFDLPGGVHVPLNRGRFMDWTLAAGPGRVGFTGILDGDGRAQATLSMPPSLGGALVGEYLHFAAVFMGPTYDVTEPVLIQVVP